MFMESTKDYLLSTFVWKVSRKVTCCQPVSVIGQVIRRARGKRTTLYYQMKFVCRVSKLLISHSFGPRHSLAC